MRNIVMGLAGALTMGAAPAVAQEDSGPSGPITWDYDPVIVDNEGICNLEADENPFARFNPKGWREKYKINCWFPVVEGASKYYIKVYDWGSAPQTIMYGADGISRSPIDIWVQGLHQGDKTVKYRKSLTLYRFVCASRVNRYAALQFLGYGPNGEIMEEWERPRAQTRAAVPETKEEAFANAVCG